MGLDAARAEATLTAAGISLTARPETLPVEAFVALFRQLGR
jgi:16S rRNA A1518/A1519 N6-dimethyltransferase RsmA/KsgA/DIM1 with predicted DNA glycosylase/AP lyase activity